MTEDLRRKSFSGTGDGGHEPSSEQASDLPEETRATRLERIRSQLAAGQYRIDSEEIASKLMVCLTRAPESGK